MSVVFPWLLIVLVHGWGAGVGSTGNAVAVAEFTSRDRCEAAMAAIKEANNSRYPDDNLSAVCVLR